MIFADPSELGSASRIPQSLIDETHCLRELEEHSGADWLISTLQTPAIDVIEDTKASELKFRKHLDHGLLMQRKTTDLASSLPELARILGEMTAQKPKFGSWLLFVGDLYDKDGKPMIDGQPVYSDMGDRLTYSLLLMTFVKWQLRGGYVAWVKRNDEVPIWINGMRKLITAIDAEPEKIVDLRPPVQALIMDGQVNMPWRSTLMSLPGIGEKKAKSIADYCGGLAWSLWFLTDRQSKYLVNRPEGIGESTINTIKNWFGLKANETLGIIDEDMEDEYILKHMSEVMKNKHSK